MATLHWPPSSIISHITGSEVPHVIITIKQAEIPEHPIVDKFGIEGIKYLIDINKYQIISWN